MPENENQVLVLHRVVVRNPEAYDNTPYITLTECPQCGIAMLNPVTHHEWHQKMYELAKETAGLAEDCMNQFKHQKKAMDALFEMVKMLGGVVEE